MCKSLLLQITSVFLIAGGFIMVHNHHHASSCHSEPWCGEPNPGDVGWGLLIAGLIIFLLGCLPIP